MTDLGIAIVNYRGAADTADLVRSLVARHDPTAADPARPSVAIALVENGDQPAELAEIARYATGRGISTIVLHGHGNVGYAAGNNLGADWLLRQGAQVVWVLNPDTRITGGTLTAAARLREAGDRVLGATARSTPEGALLPDLGAIDLWTGRSGRATVNAAPLDAAPADVAPVDAAPDGRRLTYVSGHSLLATRGAWLALRGFCEDFFLFFEEADLALRAARLGIRTVPVAGLTVAHAGGAATGASRDLRVKSGTAYFHASRSCAIFFRRHYRGRLPVMVAARFGYAAKALVYGGPAAAGAVIRGTLAGLRADGPARA